MHKNLLDLYLKLKEIKQIGYIRAFKNNYILTLKKLLHDNTPRIYIKKNTANQMISIFSMNISSAIKSITEEFGVKNENFVVGVSAKEKVLYNKKYFKIYVDWKNKCLKLNVYTKDNHLIASNTCWDFVILDNMLKLKTRYLVLVNFSSKKKRTINYYWYNQVVFYEDMDFYKFLKCLEKGLITIKFKVLKDKNSIVDFIISTSDLDKIYASIFKE